MTPGRRSTVAAPLIALTLSVAIAAGTEFMPPAVLPEMAAEWHASASNMGVLVSCFPFAVGIASFPVYQLTKPYDRRNLISVALVGYVVSNGLMCLSGSFSLALLARILGGLSHAVLLSLVPDVAAGLVPREQIGRAVSVLWIGTATASVLLVPLGAEVGALGHWRLVFGGLSAGALVMVLASWWLVPTHAGLDERMPSSTGRPHLSKGLVLVSLVTFVVILGHFVLFTFVSPVLLAAHASEGSLGVLLLAFGLAGVAGLAGAAVFVDRRPRTALVVALLVMTVAVVAFHPWPIESLLVWGVAFGSLPTFLNAAALRAADEGTRAAGPVLINSTFNLGAGFGAITASVGLHRLQFSDLNFLAAVFLFVGLLVVLGGRRSAFPDSPEMPPPPPDAPVAGEEGSPRSLGAAHRPAGRLPRRGGRQDGPRVGTLVIGSGLAGGALSYHLLNRNRTDLLVLSSGRMGASADDARTQDQGWRSANEHFRPVPGITGHFGGRADRWSGVVLPIDEQALSAWPPQIAGALAKAYGPTRDMLQEWKGAPLGAATCEADEEVGAGLAGGPLRFQFVPRAARPRFGPQGRRLKAYNPIESVLETFPETRTDSIIDQHRVGWIEPGPDAGLTVVAHHDSTRAELRVRADRVVLAAGTLETTRLLAQAHAALAGSWQTIWPRLATKIKHGVLTRPAGWMLRSLRPGEQIYLVAEVPEHRANLFFEISFLERGFPVLDLWWFAEPTPEETGVVTFRPGGSQWSGTVDCRLGPRDQDLQAHRENYARTLLRDWGCPAADPALPAETSRRRAGEVFDGDRPVRYRNLLGLSDHESGTVAVGKHLTQGFGSKLVDGLYVAGPATFVRAGAANPGLTVLALADLTARELAT